MRRSALPLCLLLLALLASPGRADEAWARHAVGRASVALPADWTVEEDPVAGSLTGTEPIEAPIRVRLERVDLSGEVLEGDARTQAFAEHHLRRQRALHPADAQLDVLRVAERTSCGVPVRWTWLRRPWLERVLLLHAVVGDVGHALRIDVPPHKIGSRQPERIAATFLVHQPDADAGDVRALSRVLDALAANPPESGREYRGWLAELELAGEVAEGHYRALARAYVDGPGRDDRAAHAWLGDRRFAHPLPEWLDFRGHPFLRVVEDANEKEWFAPEEEAAWDSALEALGPAAAHVRRLAEDRRYRAGDRVFANVAHDPRLERFDLTFLWAEPFALVYVATSPPGESSSEILAERAATLQRVYRDLLARFGERLDLKDLMEPWGGRPDYEPGVRSFPDGAPLTVLVLDDDEAFRRLVGRVPPQSRLDVPGRLILCADPRPGEVATGGIRQVLGWFTRQRNKWGWSQVGLLAPIDGFAEHLAARLVTPEGEVPWVEEDLRRTADALVERLGAYPVFPLRELVGFQTANGVAGYAAGAWSLPGRTAMTLYEHQAYALARMLEEADDGAYREPLLELLDAAMHRETDFGMATQVFARAFGLRGGADWERLDAAWQEWLRERMLGGERPVAADLVPGRLVLLVTISRHVEREGGSVTEVSVRRVRGAEAGRDGRREVQVKLPEAGSGTVHARLAALLESLAPALEGDAAGTPVSIRHLGRGGPYPPWEDMRLILLALFVTGHEDIRFETPTLPEARALVNALKSSLKEERR